MDSWHLIAGLGNPGARYARTRHNAGFRVLDRLARRWESDWAEDRTFQARLARAEWQGKRWVLCQPLTYMNSSGEAVGPLTKFYKIAPDRLLVVVDDADLALGTLRLRPGGSSGGHHGLESVGCHLGTTGFARLRVGIGRADPRQREIAGYVLAEFGAEETPLVERVLERACEQIECWGADGIERAMNRFNGVVKV